MITLLFYLLWVFVFNKDDDFPPLFIYSVTLDIIITLMYLTQ